MSFEVWAGGGEEAAAGVKAGDQAGATGGVRAKAAVQVRAKAGDLNQSTNQPFNQLTH